MARGQLTFLQLCNRVLFRLGKPQVASADFAAFVGDTWGGIVKDCINDAQSEISKEHDWSTLQTSGTFTTSDRTYDMTVNFSDFGRETDLVDTTNTRVLTPVNTRDIDEADPGLDDTGAPSSYAIDYPNLLFDRTPTDTTFRLRYFKRPTTLTGVSDVTILPEYCDLPMIWWAVWQLQASREDAQDGGEGAQSIYSSSLARAIGQDRRRTDQLFVMRPLFRSDRYRSLVPFPSNYPASWP